MSISRIWAIFIRQFFLFKGNPTRLISIFIWLIVDIVQWGFITRYLATLGQATFSFVTFILGAIILFSFMTRIQQGIMMAFLEDIWSQNFINIFASPLRVKEYLSGLVLTSTTTSIVGFIVMVVIAGVAFGYSVFKLGMLLLPFMAILFFFGVAMGIFVSAIIFRLGPSAEWLGWPIPLVLSIFSGVYYPIGTLPPSLRIFSALVPPSYIFEGMRVILTKGVPAAGFASDLLIAALLTTAYLLLAALFFNRIYLRNLKSGSIARFNAEAL
jgi:ABC-2 type transport system permease protein